LPQDAATLLSTLHIAVVRTVLSMPFIERHGLYRVSRRWLEDVEAAVLSGGLGGEEAGGGEEHSLLMQASQVAVACYSRQFRSVSAGEEVAVAMARAAHAAGFPAPSSPPSGPAQALCEAAVPLVGAVPPISVTPRVLRVWHQILFALRFQQPMVVIGEVGSGKSEAVEALAIAMGVTVDRVLMSRETSMDHMLGSQLPAQPKPGDGDAPAFEWCDGPVRYLAVGLPVGRVCWGPGVP
jgi:hypothetical protein